MSASQQSTTGYADVNGVRLYYEVAGEGHSLVLQHEGIADCRMWDDQFGVFAQRYRVVRYDYRGFGKSSMQPGAFSLRDDLLVLLRVLGIVKTYLLGASLGGSMTVDFALEHPDIVDAIIPVAPGLSGLQPPEEEATLFEPVEEAIKAGDLDRANDLEVHIWVDGPNRAPDQVDPAVREKVRVMNGDSFKRQDEWTDAKPVPLEPPAVGRLGEIHVPTLVIIGDEDVPHVQRAADAIASGIAGAKKVVMHNTAHVLMMERPEEFNRIVLDFLASLA
jgi:3-oxoadipate enol-lactonase